MVDRPSPASQSEVDAVLKSYGLGGAAPAAMVADPSDAVDLLKGYGVTLKPQQAAPAERSSRGRAGVDPGDLSRTKPGKISEPIEPPPTKNALRAGEKRGLPMQFVGAVPVAGPLINLATAALPSPDNPGATFSQRFYDQSQADRAFAHEYPVASTLANVAGSGVGYGGIGAVPRVGPALFGLSGPTWGARVYQGMAGGAGLNAIDASLRGENPVTAAEIGAVGGLLGPTAAEGARAITSTLATRAWPRPDVLRGVPRAGIELLTNALQGETPQSIAAAKARMGPYGFLADLNPAMTDIAGGISDMAIPEKALVQEAYRTRASGQSGRIDQALTKATGIPGDFDIVKYEKFLAESRKAASDPLYKSFRDTQVQPTPELQALIPRLEKVGAFDEAEFLSGATGTPINRKFFTSGPQKDYPTTETWDLVKRGLDSKIEDALSSGNKTRARALISLKGEMMGEIEKTNAGTIWKQARQEFASRSALMDQLTAGRDTFLGGRSGMSVDELRDELSHLSPPELAARLAGMRKAVAEAMGDRTESAAATRSKLLAPNNQEKMRLMLGWKPGAADELIDALHQEKYLADKTPAILPNMNTGASGQTRSERRRMFDPPEMPPYLEGINLTQPASLVPAGMRPHNVLQAFTNERAGRVAPSLAPIMLRTAGPAMDDLIAALAHERDRVANVTEAGRKFLANPLSVAIAGPGQAGYRSYYENQRPALPPPP